MKSFLFKIKNSVCKIFLEIFIYPKSLRAKLKARWAKKVLQKYANIAISEPFEPVGENSNIIWQYWHQGIENAPDVIKKATKSVEKIEKDEKINVLSFETIKDYVELPQRYYDLVNSGKMPIALFSDVLRVYLLNKYGGTWIDSTVYLSGKIPQNIIKADYFGFQMNPLANWNENKTSCWFIHSKKASLNIQAMKRALDAYWGENDFMFNYFMFEHLQTIFSQKTIELKSEWDKMPYIEKPALGLISLVYEQFNAEKWQEILSKSWIHKLSYRKSKCSSVERTCEDTFFDHL